MSLPGVDLGLRPDGIPQDYQTAYGFGGADAYGRSDWLAGRLPGSSALTAETLSKAYSNTPQFGR